MSDKPSDHLTAETFEQTVLVVDDNPSDLKIINSCLKESGYRTAVATSGKIALEQVKRIHPDLILLDILMPGMEGFEVCLQLKKDDMIRAIPIIFMTALDTSEDNTKFLSLSRFFGCLYKGRVVQ